MKLSKQKRPKKKDIVTPIWQTYEVDLSAVTGSFADAEATGRFLRHGVTILVAIAIVIDDNGTADDKIEVSLPFAVRGVVAISGRTTSDIAVICGADEDTDTLFITKYDGTYPGVTGQEVYVSGFYETTVGG